MTTMIAVEDRLFWALESLGNVQHAVETALRRYTVEQILAKIARLQAEDRQWQQKYGCDYGTFVEKVAADEEFYLHVNEIDPTWEADLLHWEFCHEGVKDWRRHLETLFAS